MSEAADKFHKMDMEMTEMRLKMKRMERTERWTSSLLRRLVILAATYILSVGLMLALQLPNCWLHALVPTVPVVVDILVELLLRRRWSN